MAKANFDGARARYESISMGEDEWLQAMDRNPDIMWSILADIYSVVRDEAEREAGKRRMGRRPTRAAGSLDELMATVMPAQFTTEPFVVVMPKLMEGRSQGQLARRVPCDQSTISRLLAGTLPPDMLMLERIAVAVKVAPHFFVEYRALYIGQLIARILTEHPNLGVAAFKRLRSAASA